MEISWSKLGDVLFQIDKFDTFNASGDGVIFVNDEDLDSELAIYQSCTVLYIGEKYDPNKYSRSRF